MALGQPSKPRAIWRFVSAAVVSFAGGPEIAVIGYSPLLFLFYRAVNPELNHWRLGTAIGSDFE